MIELAVDDRTCSAEENELLIDVLQRAGTEVPHICYHAQ